MKRRHFAKLLIVAVGLLSCGAPREVITRSGVAQEQEILSPPAERARQVSPDGLDVSLDRLSSEIEKSMVESKKTKIAVIDFSDLKGNVSDFGIFLSEELITRLFMTKKFEVVERRLLNKVLEEQSLTVSDLFEEQSAKQIGRILGVEAIATGTYASLEEEVRINARIITTETAKLFAVASAAMPLTKDVIIMLGTEKEKSSRWAGESESAKRQRFDDHIQRARGYLQTAANSKNFYNEVPRYYKSTLAEIELALMIYPDDANGLEMRRRLQSLLR